MVLESLISAKEAVKKPFMVFLLGIIVTLVCLFVSFMVFEESVGLFSVFLITITAAPFNYRLLRYAEAKEEKEIKEEDYFSLSFWERNREVILVYVSFFCGMILTMSLIYVTLPEHRVEKLFENQIKEINIIRGKFEFQNKFTEIFLNNISVLTLSFLFAFLFGSGAIFILAWNASVLASAIGIVAKSMGGIKGIPIAVLMFFPHGSLEILAYFIGGIAGGIASITIARRKSLKIWYVLGDALKLMMFSVFLLIVAALIETVSILL